MIKKTPLYEWHASNSNNVVPFGGFLLPVSYSSIDEEHIAVMYSNDFVTQEDTLTKNTW